MFPLVIQPDGGAVGQPPRGLQGPLENPPGRDPRTLAQRRQLRPDDIRRDPPHPRRGIEPAIGTSPHPAGIANDTHDTLDPFRDRLSEESIAWIDSPKGEKNWFMGLDKHPLQLRGVPIGVNGHVEKQRKSLISRLLKRPTARPTASAG